MHEYDVAIIGGGPAGTAAALTLSKRRDLRVLVLEAGQYDRPKVGESLSPGVRSLLQYLEVWDAFEAEHKISMLGHEAAWGSETLGGMDFILTLHGEGWTLDRQAFDKMLAREAKRRGTDLKTGMHVERCNFDGRRWHVRTQHRAYTARYVIDAAGRVSPFSIAHGALRQRHDALTAITARLKPRSHVTHTAKIEAFENGWAYAAPIPSGEVIVSLFSDSNLIRRFGLNTPENWQDQIGRTRHIAPLLDLTANTDALEIQPAFSSLLEMPQELPMIAAGDAAAARDPLSSSGIPNAIGSGIQAARVAADALFGEGLLRSPYRAALASDHHQYLRTHWKTYQVEKRWSDSDFWRFRSGEIRRNPQARIMAKPGEQRSIFVPGRVSGWIRSTAKNELPQVDLALAARKEFPSLPDERLLLAIEDLTVEIN